MSDDTTNLVLEHLRRIRASQERMELDLSDLRVHVSAIEGTVAHAVTHLAAQSVRLDRIDERVARIERRLELVES